MRRILFVVIALLGVAANRTLAQSPFTIAVTNVKQQQEIERAWSRVLFSGIPLSARQDSLILPILRAAIIERGKLDEHVPRFREMASQIVAARDEEIVALLTSEHDRLLFRLNSLQAVFVADISGRP
jgi:hypothetical protein